MKPVTKFTAISLLVFCAFGCATVPHQGPVSPPSPVMGVYHRVEKGQTLWKISKLYNIDIDELVEANRLVNKAQIQAGQLLFIPKEAEPLSLAPNSIEEFIWPVKGTVLNSFNQITDNVANKGLDIKTAYGAAVSVARSGKVIFVSENLKGFGKTIIVQHDDNFSTVYARNSENLVKVGENVRQGQEIAKVGISGRSNIPYLHFEIRKKHIPQNPYYYLP
ncbi:MAG: LysM peptidoglycan-binding domain-containing M23 family metallopeptidase [Candidatus Omnitrophica bacterium]|nr:LysM peptidoglycan-binding domain-containing M23 family metallopeptidase [Candidatus Omnitrophota bacterium]